jgi:hypothetical protein
MGPLQPREGPRFQRGRQEGGALVLGKAQCVRRRAHGVGVGAFPLAALQLADRLARQACPFGEFLLRELDGFAKSPEPCSERDLLSENGVSRCTFHHIVSIPAAVVSENAGALPEGTPKCSRSLPMVWMVRPPPGRQTSE